MGIPALILDLPPPSDPEHPKAVRRLARQWTVYFRVGNIFFRPISTLGIAGYGYVSWLVSRASGSQSGGLLGAADWKVFALAAGCHLVTVIHSALNMQPLNRKIMELAAYHKQGDQKEEVKAEEFAKRWARLNLLRLAMPLIAGSAAMWEALRHL